MVGTIYGAQQRAEKFMEGWSSAESAEFVHGALENLGAEDGRCVVADWLPIEPPENVVQAIGKLQDLVDCIRADEDSDDDLVVFKVSIKALKEINDLLDP